MLKPTPNLYPSSLWDHLVRLVLQFRMLFTGLTVVLRLRFLSSWVQWNYCLSVAPFPLIAARLCFAVVYFQFTAPEKKYRVKGSET